MLPKYDGRRKYRSDIPSDIDSIFWLADDGVLFYSSRPRRHFKSKEDHQEWEKDYADYAICPDDGMDPRFQMRIVFYYHGELRSCFAPEIAFALAGVDYSHHWPIVFRDGNHLNIRFRNMKIEHPDFPDRDLGFTEISEEHMGNDCRMTFSGTFPSKRPGHLELKRFSLDWTDASS